ncbi:MAG TPA: hypothetical protein VM012_05980 [Flavitalea sp.]|nr:hypothetical protein [Flavitalea sp.]
MQTTEQKNYTQQESTSRIKNIFKVDETIGVSAFRLWLLRIFYGMAIVFLGVQVWNKIISHNGIWEPLPAVAYSFWGAFSALAILGLIHPLKMIPLLLVQFSYKLIWLIIVAYPLLSANQLAGSSAQGLTKANGIGIVLDLLIIPWPFVYKNFVLVSKKNA